MSKPHAGEDECLLLIQMKRKVARAAMNKIILAFGEMPLKLPDVLTILEYLTNMVYCIELMLKMLSQDWGSHKVACMYETVFGVAHSNPALMKEIEDAVKSQKYLFEPHGGLLANIADMESLYTELIAKIRENRKAFSVTKQIEVPKQFLAYLRDNFKRFYRKEGPKLPRPPALPRLEEEMKQHEEAVERDLKAIPENLERWLNSQHPVSFHHGQSAMLDWH
jgi:hypothetical protein